MAATRSDEKIAETRVVHVGARNQGGPQSDHGAWTWAAEAYGQDGRSLIHLAGCDYGMQMTMRRAEEEAREVADRMRALGYTVRRTHD